MTRDRSYWEGARSRFSRRAAALGLAAFALVTTTVGFLSLLAFDEAPGIQEGVPSSWPRSSRIQRFQNQAQLLVFVHPFCTCTRATFAELETLRGMPSMTTEKLAVTLVVVRPKNSTWDLDKFLQSSSPPPGAKVMWDDGGLEANRFRTTTSGYMALYDTGGRLLFHGGVTGSRGHEGSNYGLDELKDALETMSRFPRGGVPVRASSVFGCTLGSSESQSQASRKIPHSWSARICESVGAGHFLWRSFCAS